MKKFKLLCLLIGFLLLAVLAYNTGIDIIYKYIVQIKWNWIPILTPFIFVYIFDTLGWKYSFQNGGSNLNFGCLFFIRLAGEAINYITPTAYMGGEPIKARLLKKKGISTVDAIASVVIAKTTMTIAQILFVIAGLILAFLNFDLPPAVKVGTVCCLLLIISLVIFIIFQQKRGLFIPILDILKKCNLSFLEKKREQIESLDISISTFYHSHKNSFIISTAFHLIGWIAGFFEVYFIVHAVGVDISFTSAFIIESLFVVIKAMFFIIPGSLGAQEGGTVLIFSTLGFSATVGLTLGVVKRIREILWILIGLSILGKYELFESKEINREYTGLAAPDRKVNTS